MVSQNDGRGLLNVRRFSLKIVDDFSTQPHDVANNKARFDLFIRAQATTIKAHQCSLPCTTTTENCEYYTINNHYDK